MRLKALLRPIVVFTATLFIGMQLFANNSTGNDTALYTVAPMLKTLDSMSYSLFTRDKVFANPARVQASVNMAYEDIPKYTEAEIKEKMKLIPTEVPMVYNSQVKQFIDFFAYKRRLLMARCLANAQVYFPMFEQILDKKGLPLELKYLPVIESAFNPVAVSGAGATGLWQMMYGTGTYLGLDINTYVDERRDPYKATEAAADYLAKLYDMYGDWHLVLAAYNSGPGTVNKAIARAGGNKNFWAILPYLPAETRSYVPIYLAAVYVMKYHNDFKLVSEEPKRDLYAVDTVMIKGKVSLAHMADVLDISQDELQFLNPSLKKAVIPYTEGGVAVNLPVNLLASFVAQRNEILNDTTGAIQNIDNTVAATPKVVYYKVKKNESISAIAARYGVSSSSIKVWNHLKNYYLYPGQNLVLYMKPKVAETAPTYAQAFTSTPIHNDSANQQDSPQTASTADSTTTNSNIVAANNKGSDKVDQKCGCIYHVVQPGDTLWNIAQRYEGLTVEKLKADNKMEGPIKVGDVIKIYAN